MKVIPYIYFNGNAEEAFEFYKEAFGASDVRIKRYIQSQGMPVQDDYLDKILHGEISVGKFTIYLSDILPGTSVTNGDNINLTIMFESKEELMNVFGKLKIDGNITMPVDEMAWGSIFGGLIDKFGIRWLLNYEMNK